jgi:Na+-driven multidrug efflux pump
MLAVGGLIFASRGWLPQLFTTDPEALAASKIVLFSSFIGGPITAATLIMTATWQGLGQAKLPFYATTVGMWGIRLLSGYLLGVQLGLGLAGVWAATILDNLFRCLYLYWQYRKWQVEGENF